MPTSRGSSTAGKSFWIIRSAQNTGIYNHKPLATFTIGSTEGGTIVPNGSGGSGAAGPPAEIPQMWNVKQAT